MVFDIAEWEQLVARRAHNPKVVGSSPASATTQKPEHIVFRLFLLSISSSCNYYEKFYGVFHKNVPIETGTFGVIIKITQKEV